MPDYEDVSSLGFDGVGLAFDNGDEIKVYGGEVEMSIVPVEGLRVVAGYAVLGFDDDGAPSLNPAFVGTEKQNPRHQVTLRTMFDLPMDLELDASVFYVDGLEGVVPTLQTRGVDQYVRVDLRLGWRPVEWLDLSLVGQNLADRRHFEFSDIQFNQASQVPRAGYARVTVNLD